MDTEEGDTSLKFQFTRHGYSCNNAANIISKEFEPSIHPFAIEQLDKEKNDNDGKHRFQGDDDFDFDTFVQPHSQSNGIHVFVSPLIRTWETALLLYSQANETATTLDLYVGPYLKEKKQVIRRGNFPQNPKIIMNKFLNFINIDRVKSLINNIETICIHWPQNINVSEINSIEMKKIEFKRNSETVGGVGETIEGTVSVIKDFIIIPTDICNIKPIINAIINENFTDNKSIFLQEGNLAKFMENFNKLKSKYNNNDNNDNNEKIVINKYGKRVVHIVAHSNIMRKHLLEIHDININYKEDKNRENYNKYEKYSEANNWSFTDQGEKIIGVTEENVIEKLDFKIGVPGKHDDAINKKNYGFQTCGVPSKSLCNFFTGKPLGGKKTKKKRKNKRTNKKKNAHKKRKTHNKRKN